MALFTKESLERLREKLDLVDLLSTYLDLKKNGIFYKALCPFHEEKTASFSLKRGSHFYHCFGCGAHGDAIQFLMQHLHLTFADAVEFLAERYHVIIEKSTAEEKPATDKLLLKEALREASLFFHCYLLHSSEGKEALLYLLKRGLSLSFLKRFEIGLAPRSSGMLQSILKEKGLKNDILRESGLLLRGGNEEFFRERITFPIRDKSGMVIGFSARKYQESTGGGKYINTYETPLFKKSKILFGLNHSLSRIAKERRAYIVEGQIDCLRLIDAGLDLTVASLGTAFGQDHVKELEKLSVREVVLLFDGDDPGKLAASKTGDLFQSRGIDVKVVALPQGLDPDSFLRQEGLERLKEEIKKAVDYLRYQINFLARTYDITTPAGKNELVVQLSKQIRAWQEPIMVHESLKRLAFLMHIPEEILGISSEIVSLYRPRSSVLKPQTIDSDRVLEFDLLRWLLLLGKEKEEVFLLIKKYLNSDHFLVPIARKIFEVTISSFMEKKECDLLTLLIEINEKEALQYLEEILNKKINKERYQKHIQETIQKLLDRHWLQEKEKITKKIRNEPPDEKKLLDLMKELDFLQKNRIIVEVPLLAN